MFPLPLMLNKQKQLRLWGLFEQMHSDFSVPSVGEKYLYQFLGENPVI